MDEPETPDPSVEERWGVLTASRGTLLLSFRPDTLSRQERDGTSEVSVWPGNTREWVVASLSEGDSVMLRLYSFEDGRTRTLHAVPAPATYTVAWSLDDSTLAFGYVSEASSGVALASPEETGVRSVGCSAAFRAWAVRPDGELVVGDDSAIYLVSADNCRTLQQVDLQKRPRVAVSPTGKHVAYVHRELVFNREAYTYEPDSTLYIYSFENNKETQVTSDRYRARNLAWSPGGDRLAFDARAVEGPQIRQIAYYDLSAGQAGYALQPPDMNMPVDRRPDWSPTGNAIAFERVDEEAGVRQLAVRHFLDRRLYVVKSVPTSRAFRSYTWVNDRVLALDMANGDSDLVALDGSTIVSLAPGWPLIWAMRRVVRP